MIVLGRGASSQTLRGCLPEPLGCLQRRSLFAGVVGHSLPKLFRTVDHEGQVIAQACHGHKEGLLVGKVAFTAIHHRNPAIRSETLGHMGIERVGEVKPPQHRVPSLEFMAQAG